MNQKIKAFLMNYFCVPGSWNWAKKKMIAGYMVHSSEWVGPLKFRANPKTKVLELDLSSAENKAKWTLAATSLVVDMYSQITTYEVIVWTEPRYKIFFEGIKVCEN